MFQKSNWLKVFFVLVALVAFEVSSCGLAQAEGFALSDWGARGTGLVGGMVGRADDASAVAHNPAGITQLPGTQMLMGFTAIAPSGSISTDVGKNTITTDADRHCWVNPHVFVSHQLSDRLWLGVGLFSRFGLGDSFPHGWPGSRNLVEVKLKTVSFNPSLAWKVNDNLSLAFGVELMGSSVTLRKGYQLSSTMYNAQRLKGMGIAPGFNLAAHYKFNDQWSMGLTYRSNINMKLRADNRWDYQLGAINPLFRDCDANAMLHMPDTITFGVAWKPDPKLSLEVGTVYTMWSRYRHLNINLEGPVNATSYSDKNWKDTWCFNVSAEYKPLDWLALRAGYSFETSPMNNATHDYMTPTNGRHRMAVGAGFAWDNWTVDVAYGYVIVKGLEYEANPATGVYAGNAHHVRSHIAALSVGYKF